MTVMVRLVQIHVRMYACTLAGQLCSCGRDQHSKPLEHAPQTNNACQGLLTYLLLRCYGTQWNVPLAAESKGCAVVIVNRNVATVNPSGFPSVGKPIISIPYSRARPKYG